jgi:hypothetical protein
MCDFRSNEVWAEAFGEPIAVEEAFDMHRASAKQYLESGAGGDEPSSKRHRTRFRQKTTELCLALTHQLTVATREGLESYEYKDAWFDDMRVDPYSLKSVDVATDRGSDAVCAKNALSYGLPERYNVQTHFDENHDLRNVIKAALKESGLHGSQQITTIAKKRAFGPWGSGLRRGQIQAAVHAHMSLHTPHDSPLFKHCLPGFLRDAGRSEDIDNTEIMWEVWNALKEDELF